MTLPDDDRHAREFRGFVRILEELGSSAEHLFSRLYGVLSARDKAVVNRKALETYQNHAEMIRDRARRQTIEIARLTGILGVIDEGVVMQAPDGRVILMNDSARRLIGSIKNLWQSELGQMFRMAYGVVPVERQMQPIGEPTRVTVNNRVLGVRMAAINARNGAPLGTVMMLRDVSDDALGERLKDSFLMQMSHELRTPLTAIKGMSDVLLSIPEGQPPKRSFLEAISRNVATLDRMVVELLDISEISSGDFQVRRDPVLLEEVAFTVIEGFRSDFAQRHLRTTSMVSSAGTIRIMGDSRRLQWAVGHLMDNAVKYTPPGGEIVVRLGKVRQDRVLLEITDTGVGINPKDLPRIFERFYRGEARAADGRVVDPRGVGQGLYIADAVVRAHGGILSVASVPGDGSTFTVELPVAS